MNEVVIHGADYPHVRGIAGTYQGGIGLEYRATDVRQVFVDMLRTRCYEACEFSAANYLILRASGQDWLSALPIFPHRAFRHRLLVVRTDSPLTDPAALAGKRIGVDDYSMTAAVWVRALLAAEHGIDHRRITWVTPREQRFPIPAGANVEQVDAAQRSLEERLVAGEIDAMLGFGLRDAQRPPAERRLRTLLPDPRAAEEAYFRASGNFPIHHCVVVRNDVLARLPLLPQAMMTAYGEAKARALAQRCESLLPWRPADWARDCALLGADPMPYGWTDANRRGIGMLAQALCTQGYIAAEPDVDRLFLPVAAATG
jgi:4,5-dihydroxyphthalate decarboxylase